MSDREYLQEAKNLVWQAYDQLRFARTCADDEDEREEIEELMHDAATLRDDIMYLMTSKDEKD